MSKKKPNTNKIINGAHGKVWWDGEKIGNIKSFQAKVTMNYEEVNQSEQLVPGYKYMGYSIAGTMTMNKIDSFTAEKLADAIKSGIMPEADLIAALEDPAAYGYERVEITGVVFDEMTLMDFEVAAKLEEELPFKATGFRYMDKIS
jgi:translation elongation factor EF-1beta